MSSPADPFFPKGDDVPNLIRFGLEDSSSSAISLTLDDLPRRTTLGLEEDARLELGPEEAKVLVLESDGIWSYGRLNSSSSRNLVVEKIFSLVKLGLED